MIDGHIFYNLFFLGVTIVIIKIFINFVFASVFGDRK
jgi:hypothetical protein